jgi:3-oxoacyl-[acyl-carrier protein] reductase
MQLQGRVAVVTGGSGGLGRRICHKLAEQGAHIVIVYRQGAQQAEDVASELRQSATGEIATLAADVSDPAATGSMVEQVVDRFGRLDVLVNNAGFNKWIPFSDLESLTPELWDHIMRTNTTGPFLCTRAAAPHLAASGAGRVVNIASGAGLSPTGSSIAYAVSKAGLIHLTRCMAVALAPAVTVNCVAPGLMDGTRMTANLPPEMVAQARAGAALQRAADKDDVADQVLTFVRSGSTTGQTVVIDAGRFYH